MDDREQHAEELYNAVPANVPYSPRNSAPFHARSSDLKAVFYAAVDALSHKNGPVPDVPVEVEREAEPTLAEVL
jgi:hypothetical protein